MDEELVKKIWKSISDLNGINLNIRKNFLGKLPKWKQKELGDELVMCNVLLDEGEETIMEIEELLDGRSKVVSESILSSFRRVKSTYDLQKEIVIDVFKEAYKRTLPDNILPDKKKVKGESA